MKLIIPLLVLQKTTTYLQLYFHLVSADNHNDVDFYECAVCVCKMNLSVKCD